MKKTESIGKKRLLCVMIAIAMMVTLLPAAVFAADGAQEVPGAEAQPTATASAEAQPTPSANVDPQPSENREAQPTASASAQPSASAEAVFAPAAMALMDNGVSPLAGNMNDFVIQYYDEFDHQVSYVTIPHPITMKLEDGNGILVSQADYEIKWYYKAADGEQQFGTGNTLAFPFTSMDHMGGYPIIAEVTEVRTGDQRRIAAKTDYAKYGGITSLIVSHRPVYAGGTESGVSLSADGKTITLSGAAITDNTDDIWVESCILIETMEPEIDLKIDGTNTITSRQNSGVVIDLRNDSQTSQLNITGGGELNVDLKRTDQSGAIRPFIAGGVDEAQQNVVIDGDTTLNLKAESTVENLFSGNAFSAGPYASLRIDDGAINAETDGGRVLEIVGKEDSTLYVGQNGSISAINNCVREPSETYGSSDLAGIYFDGGEAVIDGGSIDILMKQQLSSTVCGYYATQTSTTIKNGATFKSVIAKTGETGKVEGLFALASLNLVVDNATVDATVQTQKDSRKIGFGIAFADTLAIRNGSNVTINMDGGMYSGIRFGGDINKADEGLGTVFVKNSNLTVNGTTEYVRAGQGGAVSYPDGIEACFLKTEISDEAYAVTVDTESPANDSIAVFLQKPSTEQKAEYNMFYLPERLLLDGLDGITAPDNGSANLFGYKEMPDDTTYISAEVIYGADKTKPAQAVTISRYDYVYEELKSTDEKVSVTGNIDRSAQLTVTTDLHQNCAVCDEMRQLKDTKNVAFLGDIALTGVPTPYKGELGLTFQVDNAYNGKTLSLLHCVNGQKELKTAVAQNGQIRFAVSSLSPFALYADPDPVVMKYHTVRASASEGGTISPSGDVTVLDQTDATFTFAPNAGYQVRSVLVDGKAVQTDGKTYTLKGVNANHTIRVEFAKASPKTGDTTDIAPYIWLLVVAAGAVAAALIIRRKKARSAK